MIVNGRFVAQRRKKARTKAGHFMVFDGLLRLRDGGAASGPNRPDLPTTMAMPQAQEPP